MMGKKHSTWIGSIVIFCFIFLFATVQILEAGKTPVSHWTQLGLGGYDVGALAVSPNFASDRTMFAVTQSGVFKSTNKGQSWSLATNGLQWGSAGTYFDSIAISPNFAVDKTLFVASAGYGIYRSVDAAASWHLVLQNVSALSQVAVSPNYKSDRTVFIGGSTLMKSVDGGTNWQLIDFDLVDPYTFRVQDFAFSPNYAEDQTVFVALAVSPTNTSGILKSIDGGDIFTFVDVPREAWSVAVSPSYATDQTVFVGTEAVDGVNHLLKSIDGGTTFQPSSSGIPVTDVQDIAISPNFSRDLTVYAATGGDGFYVSTNGGNSWQPLNNGLTCWWISSIVLSPSYIKDRTIYIGTTVCEANSGGVWQYK